MFINSQAGLNTGDVSSRPITALSRAACCALLIVGASFTAHADTAELEQVVVTGTALPTQYQKIGSSLTVVSGKQIEDGGYTYVPDVLRQVPGLAVSRTGPYGGLTQVRTRGAEGNHTVVLFNGVDVSDAGQGETDLSTLLSINVDRIEVLRGPQSGLYGSNALAGVINILTRKETNGSYYNGSAEYGSYKSTTLMAGGGTGNDAFYVDGGIGALRTDGFDTSPLGAVDGPPGRTGDKEGDRNVTAYLSGGIRASSQLRFDGFARYVNTRAEGDDQDFSFIAGRQGLTYDTAGVGTTNSYNLAGSGTLSLLDDRWVTMASASYTHNHAENEDGTPFGFFGDQAYRMKYGAQSSFKFGADNFVNTVTGFVENKKEYYRNTHPSSAAQRNAQERQLIGLGIQDQVEIANQLYLSGTVRRDDNDKFENTQTYSVAASWVIKGTGTRPHASYGKGVTNPSFFEQFGFNPGTFVGNPLLKPERALGWDAGVEQKFADGGSLVDITYFDSTLHDEIISCFPSSCNDRNKSSRKGVEISTQIFPTKDIDLIASYTYTKAEEGKPATPEVRRPKNQGALDANWRSLADKLQLTLGATFNGKQYDNDFRQYGLPSFVAQKTLMPSYTLLRLAASYKLTPEVQLLARVENALDKDYQEVIGYLTAGRTAYLGVRVAGGKAR